MAGVYKTSVREGSRHHKEPRRWEGISHYIYTLVVKLREWGIMRASTHGTEAIALIYSIGMAAHLEISTKCAQMGI